jgi:hypothetical protein
MVKKVLERIKKDLKRKFILKNIDLTDELSTHWGVCLYIRNVYLWKNPELVKELNEYFKTTDVDALSHKILCEIIKNER